jgi:hypothetical protein
MPARVFASDQEGELECVGEGSAAAVLFAAATAAITFRRWIAFWKMQ